MAALSKVTLARPPAGLIPEIYLPVVRAYGLAYLSTTSLQLLKVITRLVSRRQDVSTSLSKTFEILREAAGRHSFPALAATLLSASAVAPHAILKVLESIPLTAKSIPSNTRARARLLSVLRFLSVSIASLRIFEVLNRPSSKQLKDVVTNVSYAETISSQTSDVSRPASAAPTPITSGPPAGKTLFVTSIGVVNAVVVLGSAALDRYRRSPLNFIAPAPPGASISVNASAAAFIASSTIIMWCFVFAPDSLPREYYKWIASAASVDVRLVDAVRKVRLGMVQYGRPSNFPCDLPEMARDYGLPSSLGDYEKTFPIPCEVYHTGRGSNCEMHAVKRFIEGWRFAIKMYLPLNLLLLLRKKPTTQAIMTSLISAARSSAFLAGFISFFWYGLCLTRSRFGPLWIRGDVDRQHKMDGGISITAAAAACGWSILLERSQKREEMALFVAPRALTALVPQRYDRQLLWREQLAFVLSVATIMTAAHSRPQRVHGMVGGVLRKICG